MSSDLTESILGKRGTNVKELKQATKFEFVRDYSFT